MSDLYFPLAASLAPAVAAFLWRLVGGRVWGARRAEPQYAPMPPSASAPLPELEFALIGGLVVLALLAIGALALATGLLPALRDICHWLP